MFRDMARAHETWIIDLFGGLAPRDQAECFNLLATLKAHLAVAAKDGTR
jgi:hypothetical protein